MAETCRRAARSLTIDTDYFGGPRHPDNPTPGLFENLGAGLLTLRVWESKEP